MKNILFTLNGIWFALLGMALWLHFEGDWTETIIVSGLLLGILWAVYVVSTDSYC